MQGYGQFCPLAKTLEVVGGRWTLLVIRELMAGATRFSQIRIGVPLMSRTLLAQRLKELEDSGLVVSARKNAGRGRLYRLTTAGAAMLPALEALGDWGVRYAQRHLRPEDCDPDLLMWAMRRHGERAALPRKRFVVRFEFRNLPRSRRSLTTWWLLWDRGAFDHCVENPGFDVDLVVNCAIDTLVKVWMGTLGLAEAIASGAVRFTGDQAARTAFVNFLDLRPQPYHKTFRYAFGDAPAGEAAA